jgi:hyaluronate lyase
VYFPRGTNDFSGGATLGAYGVAGMVQSDDVPYVDKQAGTLPDDFVVYRNARSTKSWFLLDDEIVVLAAGISDPDGRAVVTTVDSRTAAPADEIVVTGARRDDRAWAGTGTAELRWLRYANRTAGSAVGYVFLDRQNVTVELDQVSRSRRVVRAANPDTAATRSVFGVSVAHQGSKPAAMAYALVPNADETRLRAYRRGPLIVLANDRRLQAIRHDGLNLFAVNAFEAGWQHVDRVAVHGPASVLVRRQPGGLVSLAVSDPTMDRAEISLVLLGESLRAVAADEGVQVTRIPGGTLVRVDTHHLHGRSRTATLR